MIRWDAPGLPRRVHDPRGRREQRRLRVAQPDDRHRRRAGRVEENRRIACAALGLDADRLAFNRQVHSPTVHRARAGRARRSGRRALDRRARAAAARHVARTACRSRSCAAIAPRALAVLHAGWRGLAEGVVAAGVAALGAGSKAAMVGPGDRAVLLRGRRRGGRALRRGPDRRAEARSLERRGAGAARGRRRDGRARRPLHAAAIPSSSSRIGAAGARAACRG